ncbi:hypothetical protein SeLEV6574_g04082 [Synchytrium endobioticum]|uniref:Uncharacterized protein n=1 Tax=Synchytrium endobioticum TaxID=286115 RepID=A0A507D102_9FUNG|nr:hypothetical protein SeLEV6574_g04082 [Synchytrium endobioticum]
MGERTVITPITITAISHASALDPDVPLASRHTLAPEPSKAASMHDQEEDTGAYAAIWPSKSLSRSRYESSQTDAEELESDYEPVKPFLSSHRKLVTEPLYTPPTRAKTRYHFGNSPTPQAIYDSYDSEIRLLQYSLDIPTAKHGSVGTTRNQVAEYFTRFNSQGRATALPPQSDQNININEDDVAPQRGNQNTEDDKASGSLTSNDMEDSRAGEHLMAIDVEPNQQPDHQIMMDTQYDGDDEDEDEHLLPFILQRAVIEQRQIQSASKKKIPETDKFSNVLPPPPLRFPILPTSSTKSETKASRCTLSSSLDTRVGEQITSAPVLSPSRPTSPIQQSPVPRPTNTDRNAVKRRRRITHLMPNKSSRKGQDSFARYIHVDIAISNTAMNIVDDLLHDVFARPVTLNPISEPKDNLKTLTAREVRSAVGLVFNGDLSKHAQLNGAKAVQQYNVHQ